LSYEDTPIERTDDETFYASYDLGRAALLYLPFHQVVHATLTGDGSLVLQAVIGVLVGAFVAIGLFWNRIKVL